MNKYFWKGFRLGFAQGCFFVAPFLIVFGVALWRIDSDRPAWPIMSACGVILLPLSHFAIKATRPKRMELRYLSWAEAEKLLREDSAWRIAKEEDWNLVFGFVYLEKLEQ